VPGEAITHYVRSTDAMAHSAVARGGPTGRLPRAQTKRAQKRPEGRGKGPDNLFFVLLIQLQDEQKFKFLPRAQKFLATALMARVSVWPVCLCRSQGIAATRTSTFCGKVCRLAKHRLCQQYYVTVSYVTAAPRFVSVRLQ
jgi:hypothetical protein